MKKFFRAHKATITIGFLLLLFFGPMLAAWLLYQSSTHWHHKTVNAGQLITPPLDFKKINLINIDGTAFMTPDLRGHWVLFYFINMPCLTQCQQNLYKIRQVRTALGKDRDRLQRLVVTVAQQDTADLEPLLKTEYAGTGHAVIDPAQTPIALKPGSLYLVDPLGNIMMSYPADITAKNLLNDLTRLFKTSQIG